MAHGIEERAGERRSRLDVAREEVAVEDAIRSAVEDDVFRRAGAGLGAAALEQPLRQRHELGELRIAGAMQELDAQRQLATRAPRRGDETVREPTRVAVRSREEVFGARRRPRLKPTQRRGVRVDRHRGDGRVDLQGARASRRVDEPVDARDEQLLGFAPARPQRLLFERREVVEEEPRAFRKPLDQLPAHLDQRADDEVRRTPERGELFSWERNRRQDERNRSLAAHEAQLAGAFLREPRQIVAALRGHLRE